jgi:hypothetical protein
MGSMIRTSAVTCAAGFALAVSAAARGQLILDGNMDALVVGTAPDCSAPSGAWQFPANYTAAALCEINATDFSVVATNSFQPTGSGNSLALNITDAVDNIHLTNVLPAALPTVAGQIIRVEWQVWVQATGGGASVYIGADMGSGGYSNATDRGPQIGWNGDGSIQYNANAVNTVIVPSYPRGQWQSVRVDIHLDTQKYDFYWAPSGPPALIQSGLAYRIPPTAPLTMIDRFSIAHFGATAGLNVSNCFYDNVAITLVGGTSCYPNCDNSTAPPILNANDFQCFLNRYAAGDSYANCDNSTAPPILNANDFQCFLNAYAAGCS